MKFEAKQNKGPHRPPVRRYRCHSFRECPVRALCSRSQRGRQIEVSPQHAAMRRQRSKRLDPAKRALLRRRQVIVEPVFGILKQGEGFRRWTVRGLENVRTQWALVCTAYNLKKLAQAWKQRLPVGTAYNLKRLGKAWKNRLAIATCNFRARTAAPPLALKVAPLFLPDSTLRCEF